jgi:hypothetical protein
MSTDQAARCGVQVIARAAAVLWAPQQYADGLGVGHIARQIDLPRSTIQRIVDAAGALSMPASTPCLKLDRDRCGEIIRKRAAQTGAHFFGGMEQVSLQNHAA